MSWQSVVPSPSLLRRRDVERLTGLPRSTLYLLVQRGWFPRPVRIGPRAVAWRAADVAAWIESLPVTEPKEAA